MPHFFWSFPVWSPMVPLVMIKQMMPIILIFITDLVLSNRSFHVAAPALLILTFYSFQLTAFHVREKHIEKWQMAGCARKLVSVWKVPAQRAPRGPPYTIMLSFHFMFLLSYLFKKQNFQISQILSGSANIHHQRVFAIEVWLERQACGNASEKPADSKF